MNTDSPSSVRFSPPRSSARFTVDHAAPLGSPSRATPQRSSLSKGYRLSSAAEKARSPYDDEESNEYDAGAHAAVARLLDSSLAAGVEGDAAEATWPNSVEIHRAAAAHRRPLAHHGSSSSPSALHNREKRGGVSARRQGRTAVVNNNRPHSSAAHDHDRGTSHGGGEGHGSGGRSTSPVTQPRSSPAGLPLLPDEGGESFAPPGLGNPRGAPVGGIIPSSRRATERAPRGHHLASSGRRHAGQAATPPQSKRRHDDAMATASAAAAATPSPARRTPPWGLAHASPSHSQRNQRSVTSSPGTARSSPAPARALYTHSDSEFIRFVQSQQRERAGRRATNGRASPTLTTARRNAEASRPRTGASRSPGVVFARSSSSSSSSDDSASARSANSFARQSSKPATKSRSPHHSRRRAEGGREPKTPPAGSTVHAPALSTQKDRHSRSPKPAESSPSSAAPNRQHGNHRMKKLRAAFSRHSHAHVHTAKHTDADADDAAAQQRRDERVRASSSATDTASSEEGNESYARPVKSSRGSVRHSQRRQAGVSQQYANRPSAAVRVGSSPRRRQVAKRTTEVERRPRSSTKQLPHQPPGGYPDDDDDDDDDADTRSDEASRRAGRLTPPAQRVGAVSARSSRRSPRARAASASASPRASGKVHRQRRSVRRSGSKAPAVEEEEGEEEEEEDERPPSSRASGAASRAALRQPFSIGSSLRASPSPGTPPLMPASSADDEQDGGSARARSSPAPSQPLTRRAAEEAMLLALRSQQASALQPLRSPPRVALLPSASNADAPAAPARAANTLTALKSREDHLQRRRATELAEAVLRLQCSLMAAYCFIGAASAGGGSGRAPAASMVFSSALRDRMRHAASEAAAQLAGDISAPVAAPLTPPLLVAPRVDRAEDSFDAGGAAGVEVELPESMPVPAALSSAAFCPFTGYMDVQCAALFGAPRGDPMSRDEIPHERSASAAPSSSSSSSSSSSLSAHGPASRQSDGGHADPPRSRSWSRLFSRSRSASKHEESKRKKVEQQQQQQRRQASDGSRAPSSRRRSRRARRRAWMTCFVVADTRGLLLFPDARDYAAHRYDRVLGVVPFDCMALLVPNFVLAAAESPVQGDRTGSISVGRHARDGTRGAAAATVVGRGTTSAFAPPYTQYLSHVIQRYGLTRTDSYTYFGFIPRSEGDGTAEQLRARLGLGSGAGSDGDSDSGHVRRRATAAYFASLAASGAPQPVLFRTTSAESHRSWVSVLAHRFNRPLCAELLSARAEAYGPCTRATQTRAASAVGAADVRVATPAATQSGNPIVTAKHLFGSGPPGAPAGSTLPRHKEECELPSTKPGTPAAGHTRSPSPTRRERTLEDSGNPLAGDEQRSAAVSAELRAALQQKQRELVHARDRCGALTAELRALRQQRATSREQVEEDITGADGDSARSSDGEPVAALKAQLARLSQRVAELTSASDAEHAEVARLRTAADASATANHSSGKKGDRGARALEETAREAAAREVERLAIAHDQERQTWAAERKLLEERNRLLTAQLWDCRSSAADDGLARGVGRERGLHALAAKAVGDLDAFHAGVLCSIDDYMGSLDGGGLELASAGVPPALPHHEESALDRLCLRERSSRMASPASTPRGAAQDGHCSSGSTADAAKGFGLLLLAYNPSSRLLDCCLSVDEHEAKLTRSGPSASCTGREWVLHHYDSDAELHVRIALEQVRALRPWEPQQAPTHSPDASPPPPLPLEPPPSATPLRALRRDGEEQAMAAHHTPRTLRRRRHRRGADSSEEEEETVETFSGMPESAVQPDVVVSTFLRPQLARRSVSARRQRQQRPPPPPTASKKVPPVGKERWRY